jgi:homopolymeric O-antigen transport system permease protein
MIPPKIDSVRDAISYTRSGEGAPLVHINRPESSWELPWRELWQYRELVYFLAWRDIKVRYKQTVLGAAWAILQPLFTALTLSLFLGKLAKVPSDGLPYPVFAYTAMVPWQLFSQGLTEASNSLVTNDRLITKVYFPRMAIPLSAVLAGWVDFALAAVVLIPFLAYYRMVPNGTAIAALLMAFLASLVSFGAGLWLAALNVQYRDVRYTLTFLVQLWFLASPVAYPTSVVPQHWRVWYGLNPMVGVIEGFRWALLGKGQAPTHLLAASVASTAIILVGGLYYFHRMESSFADRI